MRLSDAVGNDYCGIQGFRRRIISFPSLCASDRVEIWSIGLKEDSKKVSVLPRVLIFAGRRASVVCCQRVSGLRVDSLSSAWRLPLDTWSAVSG